MIKSGDRVDVVLDVYTEPDAYRVVLIGVFEPGQRIPKAEAGATRNVVQSWLGQRHHARVFAIERWIAIDP